MIAIIISIVLLICSPQHHQLDPIPHFDDVVNQYIEIGRAIESYYPKISTTSGPGSRPRNFSSEQKVNHIMTQDSLLIMLDLCESNLKGILKSTSPDELIRLRTNWMLSNIKAVKYGIQVEMGKIRDFDEESLHAFGIQLPTDNEQHFKNIILKLDSILPGSGTINERYLNLSNKFTIPKDKIDTIFRTIIKEARKRTKTRLQLPDGESVKLIFLNGKTSLGGSSYSSNNSSIIFLNTKFPINVYTAVEVACHEGYPGHHVYNLLMDSNNHDKQLTEFSFSPVFGPQGFMTEAIASSAREMVFPKATEDQFIKEVLLPMAGLDTTNYELFKKANLIMHDIRYLNIELSRELVNGIINDSEVIRWETNYAFLSYDEASYALETLKKFRSRIASYNYGADIIREFIKTKSKPYDEKSRWEIYKWLLTNPITPSELKQPTSN